jgi:hypothetical protein
MMRATVGLLFICGCADLLPTTPAAGRCTGDADCPSGYACATDKANPATFYRCVCAQASCADAGVRADGAAPDAAGSCGRNEDCPAARPVCGPAGRCVECAEAAHCKDPGKSFCVAGACAGCTEAGAGACKAPLAICDAPSGRCVECATDASCAADPTRPFCLASACVGCGKAAAMACATRTPAAPVCAPSGACVECTDAALHCKTAGKSFCVGSACVGCAAAGAAACKAPTAVCAPTGACVECTADTHCAMPNRPFCVASVCTGCDKAEAKACAMKNAALPVCGSQGACVECNASSDCLDAARPICGANKCGRCSVDAECAAKLGPNPGVCMAHQDGRCARDDETLYVQNLSGCGPTGGTSAVTPLCSPRDLPTVLGARRLIVVRGPVAGLVFTAAGALPVSIVGQNEAVFAGGPDPGIRLSGAADVYIRGVTIRNSENVGAIVEGGVTLRLERVAITGNQRGGLLLDGAAFDIKNTNVTGNGAGQLGLASWGGILVNAPPAAGPARLDRVSIKDNRAPGMTCSGAIQGNGVLASGNAAVDIASTCGVTSCPIAGPMCGAQF